MGIMRDFESWIRKWEIWEFYYFWWQLGSVLALFVWRRIIGPKRPFAENWALLGSGLVPMPVGDPIQTYQPLLFLYPSLLIMPFLATESAPN